MIDMSPSLDLDFSQDTKSYIKLSLKEHREVFSQVLNSEGNTYSIPEDLVLDLSRQVGISNTLANVLKSKDTNLWTENVIAMCEYYYGGSVVFLIQDDVATHVSFKKVLPLLNKEFFTIVNSTLSDYEDVMSIDSYRYHVSSYDSSVTVFHNKEFTYNNNRYRLGVTLFNDELDTITCKQIVEKDGLRFYLPNKYYNLSASRYLKTSCDREEALRQLLLRIIDNMSKDSWFSVIPEVDAHLRDCARIDLTYEEYKYANRLLSRIAVQSDLSEEDISSKKEELSDRFIDFEENYPTIDEKKNSYIWRCSALSDNKVYDLIDHMNSWITSRLFYPECNESILALLGDLIMLDNISINLAKRTNR